MKIFLIYLFFVVILSFNYAKYIYVGKTTQGSMEIESVAVVGPDAHYFTVSYNRNVVYRWWWARIRVAFSAIKDVDIGNLDAHVEIRTTPGRTRRVQITGE